MERVGEVGEGRAGEDQRGEKGLLACKREGKSLQVPKDLNALKREKYRMSHFNNVLDYNNDDIKCKRG